MAASIPEALARAFVLSMPRRYRELFDDIAQREHAAIAYRRGSAAAHAEIWRELPHGGAILCVVADDRPGLLSRISAALVVHELDVVAAQAYTRTPPAGAEAVDFFWLRRVDGAAVPAAVSATDAARVSEVLASLVEGKYTVDDVARDAHAIRARPTGATRVRFDEGEDRGLAVLTVETCDRPGLLLAISQALFRRRVQIVWTEARSERGTAIDRFHLAEFDGAPVREDTRRKIQADILEAIALLSR
jgi:[protein-PII] uridylyltransferase